MQNAGKVFYTLPAFPFVFKSKKIPVLPLSSVSQWLKNYGQVIFQKTSISWGITGLPGTFDPYSKNVRHPGTYPAFLF